ncbi:MAG TPA: SIMPL domain-containing protein [Nitrosopumilaceae archaeon]|nr:SIMPL domain-containing protein [Nitrosopumilaceae archaeon]
MTTNTNKILLAAFAAIAIIASSSVASIKTSETQAFAQQVIAPSNEKTISVTGTATTSVVPDILNIQFGVETQEKNATGAINTNNHVMNQVIAAVKKLGITDDEISTSSFTIYPIYDSITDPKTGIYVRSELVGYRVSNILLVKTEKLTMGGDIIDAAVQAGANRVDNVSFTLSPEQQLSVQDDLIGKAVMNAKSKAEKGLDPLGQKIIGVKLVALSDFNQPPPKPYYSRADGGLEIQASTQIFQSDQDITTTANVIFLIGDQ